MRFHLAAQPEYMKPLRDEIELAVREDGWNKESLSKMHRLDSFMRESQRINGIGFSKHSVNIHLVSADHLRFPVLCSSCPSQASYPGHFLQRSHSS